MKKLQLNKKSPATYITQKQNDERQIISAKMNISIYAFDVRLNLNKEKKMQLIAFLFQRNKLFLVKKKTNKGNHSWIDYSGWVNGGGGGGGGKINNYFFI